MVNQFVLYQKSIQQKLELILDWFQKHEILERRIEFLNIYKCDR
jgi:hypothetical protein